MHVAGGDIDSRDGAAADEGVDLIEVAVADDHMAPEFFQGGRIGVEDLMLYQMKPRFQNRRRDERERRREQREPIGRPEDWVLGTPDGQNAGEK